MMKAAEMSVEENVMKALIKQSLIVEKYEMKAVEAYDMKLVKEQEVEATEKEEIKQSKKLKLKSRVEVLKNMK